MMEDTPKISVMQTEQVDQAVAVILEAFRTEAITASWLDLSRAKIRFLYGAAIRLTVETNNEAGNPLFVAEHDGIVVGLAMVRAPGKNIFKIRALLSLLLRLLRQPRLAALLPYLLRASHLSSVVQRPRNLPADHFTLEMLGVLPSWQDRGIGRLLLQQVEQLCREDSNSSGVYLFTACEKNRQIYEKAFYRVLEKRQVGTLTVYHMFMDRFHSMLR
jgi:GNAT superfamily N-acetyltransferase